MSETKKNKFTLEGFRKVFKLFKYLHPYRVEYTIGMVFLLASSIAGLAFPELMGDLVNSGIDGGDGSELSRIVFLLGAIFIAQSVFSYFRTVLFVNVTEKSMADLRSDTFSHLIQLPMVFFDEHRVGELNSRISADVSLVQETLTSTLADFIRQIVYILGGILILSIKTPTLTLFMLTIIPPAVILVFIFGRFIRRLSKDAQKRVAESNTIVEETLQGIRSVKSYTNEFFEIERYKGRIWKAAKIGMKSGRYRGAFSSFLTVSLFGSLVAVIWKGATMLSAGELAAGDLFSFVIYSVFIGGNIGGLASVITRMQRFIGATDDLFEIFDSEEEDIEEIKVLDPEQVLTGKIRFNNLSFAYPSRLEEFVLKDINLVVAPNQVVALVGASGAGKSTIASLLLGLYPPSSGSLEFNEKNSTLFSLSALRHQIALVPQDIFLFGGTIKENIAYGKYNASDIEIEEAAKLANAWEFIERFPDKLDTVVGERGTQVSGGQRQRIAIARAILNDPKVLILDEATSSLDSESERLVQEGLEQLMKGRTSIVIAHRLSTIRNSDRIVVLEQGIIVEQGTHEELMKDPSGNYRKLTEMQIGV